MFEEIISVQNALFILLIQALATCGLAIFAYYTWRAQRNNTIHNALLEMHYMYGSHKIGDSVRNLWDFYRDHCGQSKEKVKTEFKKILKRNTKERKKQYDCINNSRRLVSQFYLNMAELYYNNILGWHRLFRTKRLFFEYWSDQALQILPEIIIPLEDASQEWLEQQTRKEPQSKRDDKGRERQYNFYFEAQHFYWKYRKKIERKQKAESKKFIISRSKYTGTE
jgi:hypothetical protein